MKNLMNNNNKSIINFIASEITIIIIIMIHDLQFIICLTGVSTRRRRFCFVLLICFVLVDDASIINLV